MIYLLDSCIMIDFLRVDESLLGYINRIGQPAFMDIMRPEVPFLKQEHIERWNIHVVESHREDIAKALEKSNETSLSFEDCIFYLTAMRHDFTCVTMDGRLRKQCLECGLRVYRSLGLLLLFVNEKIMGKYDAECYAKEFHTNNTRITDNVLEDFYKNLREK